MSTHRFFLFLAILLALALRLYRLGFQNIWWDEARNLDVARRALTAIAVSPELDIHPPLYFYSLHFWERLAGNSEFAVRFHSTWWGLLTIPVLYRLGRRLGGQGMAAATAAIAAVSPALIGEAQETRMYTMALFWLCLGGWSLWHAAFGVPEHFGPYWGAFILCAAAALATHYSTVFVLATWYLFLMGWWVISDSQHWRSRLRAVALSGLGIGALLLPLWPIAWRQITPYRNPTLTVPTWRQYLLDCWQAFTLGLDIEPERVAPWLLGIAAVFILGLLVMAWERRPLSAGSRRPQALAACLWLLSWLTLPLLIYYVVLLDRATFHPRYILFVLPALILLLAWGLAAWWRRVRLVGIAMALVLAAAVVPALNSHYHNPAYFREDTAGLAHFLAQSAGPDDVILVDVPYPFPYYYDRLREQGQARAPAYYLFVDIHTVAERLNELCAGRQRAFWVEWFKSDTDPRGVVSFLLQKHGQLLGERLFRGYRVSWYQLPQPAVFSVAPQMTPTQVSFSPLRLTAFTYGGRGAGPTSTVEETAGRVLPADKRAWAVLQWQLDQPVSTEYKATLIIRDQEGRVLEQDDRYLLNDRHLRTPHWTPGEPALNVYSVALPPGTPPGEYELALGVYEAATLQRLNVLDEVGAPAGTTASLGKLTVIRPATPPPVTGLAISVWRDVSLGPVRLLGYDLPQQESQPGLILPLTLYWQATTRVEADYLARLALRDASGREVSPVLRQPLGNDFPTSRWQEGDVFRGRVDFRLAPETPPGDYTLVLSLLNAANGESLGEVVLERIAVSGRPHQFALPVCQHPLSLTLGSVIRLLGYDLTSQPEEDKIELVLYWQALAEIPQSYTVFVHLLDQTGRVAAQQDNPPQNGAAPTTSWLKGEVIKDVYSDIPTNLPAGEYLLEVGLYEPITGLRLIVADEAGATLGDRVLLEPIHIY